MKRFLLILLTSTIILGAGYWLIKKCQYNSVLEHIDIFIKSDSYVALESAARDMTFAIKSSDSLNRYSDPGRIVDWGPILLNEKMDKCIVLYYDELKTDPKMLRSNIFFGTKNGNEWKFNNTHIIALNSYVWDKDEKQMVRMVEEESLKTLINDGLAKLIPCTYNYSFVDEIVDDINKKE